VSMNVQDCWSVRKWWLCDMTPVEGIMFSITGGVLQWHKCGNESISANVIHSGSDRS
jgi:hypothetical protein